MNKLFLYLIIIGVLTLLLVSGWEILQVSSGAKSSSEFTVIEIENPILIPENIENHLREDPNFTTNTSENIQAPEDSTN